MKRITIRDIAKMLSLSPSTVSRALSNHPDISDATKARVNEVAHTFNYTVNLHSNFFRNRKSNLIALIIPEINMFFTPRMIRSINNALSKTEYSLSIFISNDSYEKEKEMIEQSIKWAASGVLISLSSETKDINHLKRLHDFGIKTVMLDRIVANKKFHSVTSDSYGSGYKAVNHLIQMGHKNILGLFGNSNLSITQHRISGFRNALEENGLDIESSPMFTVKSALEVDKIIPVVLSERPQLTSIFVMSDELLARVHYMLTMMNKKIRDDISLIAISDGEYPHFIHPNVTYIKDSGSKMGKKSIQTLLNLIEGHTTKLKKKTLLKTKLIELNSVNNMKLLTISGDNQLGTAKSTTLQSQDDAFLEAK
ncbi:MAG: LacI family DNA-binding transcriptional regulator [Bacteroidota bacterium]